MIEIDHVIWASPDLDDGVASLRGRTGFDVVPGGSHPGWGTRNALVGLGDTYLEVLATDPAQDGGWFAEELHGLSGPTLHRWALRTDEMDAVVRRVEAAGLRMAPRSMSRETPDGRTLRWRIAFVEGHDLGVVVPFVIDWLDTVHPARTLATQGSLEEVAVAHPEHGRLTELLGTLGLDLVATPAVTPSLAVTVRGPTGDVTLA